MSMLRGWAVPIGGIAALLLIYLVNPWLQPEGALRQIVTVAFWAVSIALAVVLFEDRKHPESKDVEIEGPAFARFLFGNSRAGLFWLPIRIFVGFSWLEAGWHKLTDPEWTQGGAALRAYWERAAAIPEQGRPPIITLGELAVGLGLLLGALTGIAAFFGAFMSMSFLLAGSASTNPVMFTLAVGLMLAWKVAGDYGLDRYLLPRLGTPWTRGALFLRQRSGPAPG